MQEGILMVLLGVVLLLLGVNNCRGHIASIHWYNRRRVSPEQQKPYGRWMGLGTGLMGLSLVVTGALQVWARNETNAYILLAGVVVGLGMMLYAQFKYNKGIF